VEPVVVDFEELHATSAPMHFQYVAALAGASVSKPKITTVKAE
jgi:hypothetical protein